jgi:endoglucanase
LNFDLPDAASHFAGAWDPAKHAYAGQWSRQGQAFPLSFARGKLPPPPPVNWDAPVAPGLAYAPGPAAHAATGISLPVGKCINMSNMLEAPVEGGWGPAIADDDFRIVGAAGFSTVRIPVRWSAHALAASPYTIDPAFLGRVHHVVALATASGLNVILNVHHYDELMSSPADNAERFASLWRQIAASFAAAPPTVWFELLNEPHDKLTNANWMPILRPALAAVRATNPTRPVLIGGQDWNSLDSLSNLQLPDDRYVVPTFHYYDPFAFTHQGANWLSHAPPIGRPYGNAADKILLDQAIGKAKDYIARTGRVPILGEYGATDDPRVPLAQRVRYYRTISAAFASVGVQSCLWGYRSGFPIRVGDHWLPGLVEAIATTTTTR